MKATSPYLTSKQAADFLGLPSLNAFHKLCSRLRQEGTPLKAHRFRARTRYQQRDLERLIVPPMAQAS